MRLTAICLALAGASSLGAMPASATEIHVSLFGQPCDLQGPLDEPKLRIIHSLSPEQIYPDMGETPLASAPVRKSIDKLKAVGSASGAPASLDRYRERLSKRLDAQLAMLEAFDAFKKSGKLALVYAASKAKLPARRQKEFDAAVRKAEAAKTLGKSATLESLLDTYNDGIEADPEEEFHRAIQKLGVQYTCSFEENGAGDDGKGDAKAEGKESGAVGPAR